MAIIRLQALPCLRPKAWKIGRCRQRSRWTGHAFSRRPNAHRDPNCHLRPQCAQAVGRRPRANAMHRSRTGPAMRIKRLPDWQVKIAFGSAIVALLVVAAFSYRGIVASNEGARWLSHTHEVRENLQKLQTTMEQVQSSSRAFILTGTKVYLETFAAGVLRARQLEAAVRSLTADNPEQQRQLPALELLITQKIGFAEQVIDLRRRSGLEAGRGCHPRRTRAADDERARGGD